MRQNASTRTSRQRTDIRRARTRPFRHRRPAVVTAFQADRRPAATNTRSRTAPAVPEPILLGAATWLACGVVLLGLTPLPLRNPQIGWSLSFWALAAPLVVLLALCIRRCKYRTRDE
jgi:hypothetical protein